MHIANNLKYLREKNGLNVRRLSILSNVPYTVIKRIENGDTPNPGIVAVSQLAITLETDLTRFVHTNMEAEIVPVTGTIK